MLTAMSMALNTLPPVSLSASPGATEPAEIELPRLGRAFRRWRETRGWSLRDVARRLELWHLPGSPWWALAAWERGERVPSLRQFATLCHELELGRQQVGILLGLARARPVLPSTSVRVGIYRWHPSTPPIGVLMRRRRAELALTADDVAGRVRSAGAVADKSSILRWERGERMPGLSQWVALVDVLECDPYTVGLMLGRAAGRAPTVLPIETDFTPSADRPVTLDLATRLDDALRILRRHPLYRRCVRKGLDRDDVEQRILCRLLERQTSVWTAYDPERSCLSRYLDVAMTGLLSHILEEQRGLKHRLETVGATGLVCDGELVDVDAAEIAVDETAPDEDLAVAAAIDQAVAVVVDEFGRIAGDQARALFETGDTAACPRAVRELVRELLRERA